MPSILFISSNPLKYNEARAKCLDDFSSYLALLNVMRSYAWLALEGLIVTSGKQSYNWGQETL